MPKAFLVDTTRCTACRGCQLACKEWHDLPANETKQRGSHQNPPDLNPNNYKIVRFHEHLDKQGNVVWNFFPDQCRHCVTPICVDVADMAVPGAMIKDPKTGAVLVTDKIKKLSEQDMADVIHACPYNIPRYDKVKKTLAKCDMCADEVARGRVPICVATCPMRALDWGDIDELRQKYGEGNVEVEPLPKNTTSPCLVLDPHPAAQATGQGTGEVVNLEEELDL